MRRRRFHRPKEGAGLRSMGLPTRAPPSQKLQIITAGGSVGLRENPDEFPSF